MAAFFVDLAGRVSVNQKADKTECKPMLGFVPKWCPICPILSQKNMNFYIFQLFDYQ